MIPRKFVACHERRAGRRLTPTEANAVANARATCTTGKRDTVKAMTEALRQCGTAGLPPPTAPRG